MDEALLSQMIAFDCNGNWRKGSMEFNPKGFYKAYHSDVKDIPIIWNSKVILFGRELDFLSALWSVWDWLFSMCSSALMEIKNLETDIFIPCSKIEVEQDLKRINETASHYRKDISIFLNYVYYFITLYFRNIKSYRKDELLKLEIFLNNLESFIHKLDRFLFTEQFILQCTAPDDDMLPGPAYQLIHCCLDLRGFCLLLKFRMNRVKHLQCFNLSDCFPSSDSFDLLMAELILMSMIKFKWIDDNKNIFPCTCIKEFWVLLFTHLGKEVFWDCLNKVLHTVLCKKNPSDNKLLENLCRVTSLYFKSINEKEFTLHFLSGIADLNEYIHCKTDYPINTGDFVPFYDNVNEYLSSNPSEKSLRRALRLISSIMNKWLLETERVLVLIWEFFYKRMDVSFVIPSHMYKAKITELVKDFLNEIKSRFSPMTEDNQDMDSFEQFLRILAIQVQRHRMQGYIMKNLYSRIHVKFNFLRKFREFKEIGLYRTCSLYLTIAIAYDIEKETNRLLELLPVRMTDNLTRGEKIVKWKTLVACLLLFAENGLSVRYIIRDMISEFQLATSKNCLDLTPIFLEGLQTCIENRYNYLQGIDIVCMLTDNWITEYLKHTDLQSVVSFFHIYNPLIEELHGSTEWWTTDDVKQLENRLCSFVLPCLNTHKHALIAGTAVRFLSYFIAVKNWAQAYSLYKHWMLCDDKAGMIPKNFILSYFKIEGNINKLGIFSCDYSVDVIQVFIKYQLLNEVYEENRMFAEIINTLPNIAKFSETVSYNWVQENNILAGFIRLLGHAFKKFSSLTEKSNVKELCSKYFKNLENLINSGLTSARSCSTLDNIYHCSAILTVECHEALYEESSQQCILTVIIDKLFLPTRQYKNYEELPIDTQLTYLKHLNIFIHGLMKLYNKYSYVRYAMENILEFNFTDQCLTERALKTHPFYLCLEDLEITSKFSQLLLDTFVAKRHNSDRRALNCVRIFCAVSNSSARDRIFENIIHDVLILIPRLEDSTSLLAQVLNYIDVCIRVSHGCRCALEKSLKEVASNRILLCPAELLKLLRCLRGICKEIHSLWTLIKQEIATAEKADYPGRLTFLR